LASCIRGVIEALIRKLQSDVTQNTSLVPPNDYYEIKQTPSLLVIGPKLEENRSKRVSEKRIEVDRDNLSYTERNWPRYYHLDFDFVLTAANGVELLDLQEKAIVFFLDNLEIIITGFSFNLREMVPIGGLDRPNYSICGKRRGDTELRTSKCSTKTSRKENSCCTGTSFSAISEREPGLKHIHADETEVIRFEKRCSQKHLRRSADGERRKRPRTAYPRRGIKVSPRGGD